ncbi:MAG: SpoVG family protein [Eubacterium sp.]|nr:SpoVG family protein [Eubacterium sp.]
MDIKVSSITLLNNEESKTKAMATLVVNDEFAIHGVKVIEGKNGAFVQMPQKRDFNGNYNDIAFPATAELREQISTAVLERYQNPISVDDLQLIGSYETKCDIPKDDRTTMWDDNAQCYCESDNVTLSQLQNTLAEAKQFAAAAIKESEDLSKEQQAKTSQSKITVSLHDVRNNDYIKAEGQIVIDDVFVIKGVKVTEGTVKVKDEDGTERSEKKNFVNMPSYQTSTGDYSQYAHPITRECYDKINSCVMAAYQNIGRFTYKGVKYAELGEQKDIYKIPATLNNKFAEKLMAELDKREIPYHAKIAETTVLSVKATDKETVESTRKELKDSLTPPKPKHNR